MSRLHKYNIYDAEGRIIAADVNKKELAAITGTSSDTIRRHLLGIVCGQKERYREYTIECVLDRTQHESNIPNTAAWKLLDAEWERTCRPFRALRRKKDADDK